MGCFPRAGKALRIDGMWQSATWPFRDPWQGQVLAEVGRIKQFSGPARSAATSWKLMDAVFEAGLIPGEEMPPMTPPRPS